MNLLIITSVLNCGGAETHVVTLARALRQQGHAVTVASAGGKLAEALKDDGIPHHTLPLHSCLHLPSARRRLKQLLQKKSFTLIHTHSRLASFVASPLARRQGIPLVTTVHARFRATPLLRKFSRWGASPIAVSEDLKQYLCETYHIPPDRVTVIPNGIEPPPPSAQPPADKPRLIFCSRLDADCARGALLLCQIAPRLRERFPDLELLLVGGGTEFSTLQRIANKVNEAMKDTVIRCVGAHSSPISLFPTARAVIGVSRVALEAMATGTPVILAGNEGFLGISEKAILPRAEATNFCCRGETPVTEDKLYDACCRLLGMGKEERNRLGKELSEYIQTHHSIARVAAETEAVYQAALQNRPSPAPRTLVLCGYYGYGNMGDDALLAASLQRAKKAFPTLCPTVLTKSGKKDAQILGIRCVKRLSVQALQEIKHAKALVFGGGTLLQDLTSLRSLCYYTTIIRLAKHHGARVELWANGIHPPTTALGKRILTQALRRCDRIGLRDRASLRLAKEVLGENAPIIYEQDLAYPTPASTPPRIEFLLRHARLNDRFAVIAPKGGSPIGILKILTPWLCTLRAEGITLVFIPLYPKEDEALCRTLALHKNDRVMTALSPSDLVGLMKKSEVVCGMRLHSLIFAASANTPFVGFGLDPKIESFCREHGGLYFTDL